MTRLERRHLGFLVASALIVPAVCIPNSPLSIRAATSVALQAGQSGTAGSCLQSLP